jgi:hypothetical protein
MKKTRLGNIREGLLITVAVFISMTMSARDVVNFSGSWILNESKSNLGEGGQRMLAKKLNIIQGENSITMEKIFNTMDGDERKITDTYTLDGKESVNPIFNTTKKSIAGWSADNKSLKVSSVTVFNLNGEANEIKTVEEYSLGDDGKTLIIKVSTKSPRGERQATLVYDRVP